MAAADERDPRNLDPITEAPGSHPVGTGVGATGGGVAGAAIGAIGGPVGAAVGLVAGAIVGGLAGKATAERINPTAEEAYWRESYTREPYYEAGRSFDDYGPAYAYGWGATATYPGAFEEVEPALERDWQKQRGASSLDWQQARPATRAAWDRAQIQSRAPVAGAEPADRDDVLETLNDLLKVSRDGEKGFAEAAEHTRTPSLSQLLQDRARSCGEAAEELIAVIGHMGGEANDRGSATGALHRSWVSARGSVGALDDLDMLEECERGEDAALKLYRKASAQNLPAQVQGVVERHLAGAQRNHDQIKQLRDAERARRG